MDKLTGKTIINIEDMREAGDWHDRWELTCSDGTILCLESDGGAYCSSSLSLKIKDIQ